MMTTENNATYESIRERFNRPVGAAKTAPQQPAPVAPVAPAVAPEATVPADEQPRQHFDHLTVWCDAGANKQRRVVNHYGKKVTFDNGGFVAGIVIEETGEEFVRKNSKCRYSLEAEAFAVLKAIEAAIEREAKTLLIKSDGCCSLTRQVAKKQNNGDVYLGVARKLVEESGLQVRFEEVGNTSAANRADAFLRRWAGMPAKR